MINISISPAEAFDRLSILLIKEKNGLNCQSETKVLLSEIIDSIGHYKFTNVMSSKEYLDLYDANDDCWKLISNIRKGKKFDAKIVDDINMLRFKFKQNLQKQHFGEELIEQKEVITDNKTVISSDKDVIIDELRNVQMGRKSPTGQDGDGWPN